MNYMNLLQRYFFFLFSGICFFPVQGAVPDTNENASVTLSKEVDTEQFFTDADAFFKMFVHDGAVNYKLLHTDRKSLDTLTGMIAGITLDNSSADTKLAFYLNAYNILVIGQIVDHYPIKSPLDVAGFFDKKKFLIAGSYLTLNELENTKLRPDARVHFSLVCGAEGCPRLQNTAFTPAKVQSQLEENARRAINDPVFIRINEKNKKAEYSQIFDWYKDDFIRSKGSVILFINSYRSVKIPLDYSFSVYTYNWSLNADE